MGNTYSSWLNAPEYTPPSPTHWEKEEIAIDEYEAMSDFQRFLKMARDNPDVKAAFEKAMDSSIKKGDLFYTVKERHREVEYNVYVALKDMPSYKYVPMMSRPDRLQLPMIRVEGVGDMLDEFDYNDVGTVYKDPNDGIYRIFTKKDIDMTHYLQGRFEVEEEYSISRLYRWFPTE